MAKIDWDNVDDGLVGAKAIAWDTCHKIYVLMDDEQVAKMREYGYGDEPDSLFTSDEKTHAEMLETLKEWFAQSCSLKFIQAVETVTGDPNEGFTDLIGQFDTDEDECDECYNFGCDGECADEDEDED